MTTNNEVLLTFYLVAQKVNGRKWVLHLIRPCVPVRVSNFGTFLGKCTAFHEKKYQIFRYIFDTCQPKVPPFMKKIPNFSVHFWHLPKGQKLAIFGMFAKNFDYWNQGNYTGHFSTVKIPVWSNYRESQKAENFQKTHGLSTYTTLLKNFNSRQFYINYCDFKKMSKFSTTHSSQKSELIRPHILNVMKSILNIE